MMKRRWSVTRFLYMIPVVITCIVVLQPLRLAFMNLALPTSWVDTDNTHLYHVINDYQNFDVDKHPIEKDPSLSKVQVNLSDFEIFLHRQKTSYKEFHNYFKFLKSLPNKNADILQKIELIRKFQPLLTNFEAAELLFTFDTFTKACDVAGLTYFVLEATLMGVIRHHGLIPWDDDIDVVMNAKQWRTIRNVLGNIDGFELYAPPSSQWKFYMKSANTFLDKPFKFPNLDIFFYSEDKTHIWALTKGLKHDLVHLKSDIFPLQLRPFEHLSVPVPCNLDLVVHKSHNRDKCITPEYIHKTNKNLYFGGTTAVQCLRLYDIYPFVFKTKSKRIGFEEEYLKIGSKVIQKRTVPVGCKTEALQAT